MRRRMILKRRAAAQSSSTAVDTPDFFKSGTKRLKKGFRYAEGGIKEIATGVVYSKP